MTEIDKVIKANLSDASKATYSAMYKRLVAILGNEILKTSNTEIIKKIKQVDASPNSIDGLMLLLLRKLIKKLPRL